MRLGSEADEGLELTGLDCQAVEHLALHLSRLDAKPVVETQVAAKNDSAGGHVRTHNGLVILDKLEDSLMLEV